MPSHPAISSCTLSYWLETKSINSTGWPRTQRSTCLSLELKACPTTTRLLMHLWRLETDVPNTHFRFPSMSTLLWVHCTPNKGCSQKLPSQHQGSGLAPLPVLSTQGSRVQCHVFVGRWTLSFPKWFYEFFSTNFHVIYKHVCSLTLLCHTPAPLYCPGRLGAAYLDTSSIHCKIRCTDIRNNG